MPASTDPTTPTETLPAHELESAPPASSSPADAQGIENLYPPSVHDADTTDQASHDGDDKEKEAADGTGDVKSEPLDVEHVAVADDPRDWSRNKKTTVLATIAFTSIGATLTGSIFFPALDSLQRDLDGDDALVAASVSVFIAGQGIFPSVWASLSEVTGRKYCYLASLLIYIVGTVVCSQAKTMAVFVGMRVLQSFGSSAVLALGAGTLADMYDTHERGEKLGVYYAAPLLGPSIGPLLGGAITSASSWRSTFYFLIAYGGVCWVFALFLPDTFRRERSIAWRKARDRARQHATEDRLKARSTLPKDNTAPPAPTRTPTFAPMRKMITGISLRTNRDFKVKIRFSDINPLAAVGLVVKQPVNLLVLTFSGFLFASQYCITFTASRTFAAAPYNYSPIKVGLVLLSFGTGNVLGSIGGGRYSDHVLQKMKRKNGGTTEPEMRIKSTYGAMLFLPPLFVAYAWLVQKEVSVAGPVVILFFLGTAVMVIYSSTLAFIVDANPGRSSSAVACNSLFRGVLACAASQSAEPILAKVGGNGAFYTGWAVILLCGQLALVVVAIKGKRWRTAYAVKEEQAEAQRQERREARLIKLGEGIHQ
ncbi:hypothetical protein JCM3774_005426 [Rhodotorula dairenensis]